MVVNEFGEIGGLHAQRDIFYQALAPSKRRPDTFAAALTHAFVTGPHRLVSQPVAGVCYPDCKLTTRKSCKMIPRRILLASAFASLALAAAVLAAATPFTAQAFAAAQTGGAPVLVAIHVGWRPTCRAQSPIIDKLSADPKFRGMLAPPLDFDEPKDLVRKFGAQSQSTLILFDGVAEVGRTVGGVNPQSIEALLGKAI